MAFGEDVGYTNDERLRWAGRIFRVCKLLSDQGIDVVCCSIAMYQSVRAWNRANIPNYKEIYLRVKPETLLARNQKGLYTGGHNVVGVDLPFDEPKTPDLIIQNDGERTPLEAVEEIERVLYPNIVENPIDNRDYWNRYYQDGLCPMDPSPLPGMPPLWWNRDGPWWTWAAATGGTPSTLPPWASLSSPLTCQTRPFRRCGSGAETTRASSAGTLSTPPIHRPASYDYAYSRFTIHAINQQQERMLLLAMNRAIKPGGKFSSRCGASTIRCTAGDSPRRKTRSSTTIITDASSSWRS